MENKEGDGGGSTQQPNAPVDATGLNKALSALVGIEHSILYFINLFVFSSSSFFHPHFFKYLASLDTADLISPNTSPSNTRRKSLSSSQHILRPTEGSDTSAGSNGYNGLRGPNGPNVGSSEHGTPSPNDSKAGPDAESTTGTTSSNPTPASLSPNSSVPSPDSNHNVQSTTTPTSTQESTESETHTEGASIPTFNLSRKSSTSSISVISRRSSTTSITHELEFDASAHEPLQVPAQEPLQTPVSTPTAAHASTFTPLNMSASTPLNMSASTPSVTPGSSRPASPHATHPIRLSMQREGSLTLVNTPSAQSVQGAQGPQSVMSSSVGITSGLVNTNVRTRPNVISPNTRSDSFTGILNFKRRRRNTN